MKKLLLALAASIALAGAAQATTITGTVSIAKSFNFVNPGFQIKANIIKNHGPQGFKPLAFTTSNLNLGDSFSFDLFVLRTLQTKFAGDDAIHSPFAIKFATSVGTALVTGVTYAVKDLNHVYGVIDFDGPAVIALGQSKGLIIDLADTTYNEGFNGFFIPGKAHGAVISANLSIATIPVPAALPMGMGVMALMGMVARRRKSKAA